MKTRVWDGERWRTDYVIMPNGTIRRTFRIDNGVEFMDCYEIAERVNWKLSHFTGLCDMENNEVYENHIVENEFGVRYLIAWDQENCRFKAKQPVSGSLTRSYNYPFDDHVATYVKIIGDIFTTPELLGV